jgi:hypothetical protein
MEHVKSINIVYSLTAIFSNSSPKMQMKIALRCEVFAAVFRKIKSYKTRHFPQILTLYCHEHRMFLTVQCSRAYEH